MEKKNLNALTYVQKIFTLVFQQNISEMTLIYLKQVMKWAVKIVKYFLFFSG